MKILPAAAMIALSFVAHAATYNVVAAGGGDYTTIQACANAAQPGDTCLVAAGTYDERVTTARAGTSGNRITFVADGAVTMKGFKIDHAYITIDGFDITGYFVSWTGMVVINTGGHYAEVLNCTIRENDGVNNNGGIHFARNGSASATNAVIRGNTLARLNYMYFILHGTDHLIENNTLTEARQWDSFYTFGSRHTIRRNIFNNPGTPAGGNHPDFVQVFSSGDEPVEDILFEENWLQDLPSQMCQMNSSVDGVGTLVGNIQNFTFRRNVIINFPDNCNVSVPGVTFENNTFYKAATGAAGIVFGGSPTRGYSANTTLKNNIFLEGGSNPSAVNGTTGFYSTSGFILTREGIQMLVTGESSCTANCPTTRTTFASPPASPVVGTTYWFTDASATEVCTGGGTAGAACQWNGSAWVSVSTGCPIATGISEDLIANGYINTCTNGVLSSSAKALASVEQMQFGSAYSSYKTATWNVLSDAVTRYNTTMSTFLARNNYVGGAASAGFPAKKTSGCNCSLTFTSANFCEAVCGLGGINGGDPLLTNLSNPLGADGLPFTADDGLIPSSSSPLCAAGEGGTYIGAYACGGAAAPQSRPHRLRGGTRISGAARVR